MTLIDDLTTLHRNCFNLNMFLTVEDAVIVISICQLNMFLNLKNVLKLFFIIIK